jgi:hypothetical protein
VRALSGDLSLDGQGRVHRTLPLAQFRNGTPVALEQPGVPTTPSGNVTGFAPASPALPPSSAIIGRR